MGSLARGGTRAQAFLLLAKLCLIGFINGDPGIMRPLRVGIFLKAVGPGAPARKLPGGVSRCVCHSKHTNERRPVRRDATAFCATTARHVFPTRTERRRIIFLYYLFILLLNHTFFLFVFVILSDFFLCFFFS